VTPAAERALLDDAMQGSAGAELTGEVEAIAWTYAACAHLRIDPAIVFHAGGYRGHSQGLLFGFSMGVYPGAHGLVLAGMAAPGGYPRMVRWVRE